MPKVPTTQKLAEALKKVGAPEVMIQKALRGDYDDFKTKSTTPLNDLMKDAIAANLGSDFYSRIIGGDFDAQDWEAEEWAESPEGKRAIGNLRRRPQ